MTTALFPIAMAIMALAVAAALAFTPNLSAPTTPLGVRIPADRSQDPAVISAVKTYRKTVLISGAVTAVLTMVFWWQPIVASLSSLLIVAAGLIEYVTQRKKIVTAKEQGNWFQGIPTGITGRVADTPLPGDLERLTTPRVPWFYFFGAFLITVATALIAIDRWAEIPQTVATHWGPGMEADAWADKSITTVFVPTMINVFLIALLLLITWALTKVRVHNRNDRTSKGHLRTYAGIAASNQGAGFLVFVLAIPIALMQVTNYLPAYEHLIPVTFILILVASTLGVVGLLAITVLHLQRATSLLNAMDFGGTKESPDNDEFYKWGMFYYNPDDPAVMVEKRFGVGLDFNYARWQAKVFVVFVALILVGSLALPFIL